MCHCDSSHVCSPVLAESTMHIWQFYSKKTWINAIKGNCFSKFPNTSALTLIKPKKFSLRTTSSEPHCWSYSSKHLQSGNFRSFANTLLIEPLFGCSFKSCIAQSQSLGFFLALHQSCGNPSSQIKFFYRTDVMNYWLCSHCTRHYKIRCFSLLEETLKPSFVLSL